VKVVKGKVQALNSAGKAEMVINRWEKLGRPLPKYYSGGGCCGR